MGHFEKRWVLPFMLAAATLTLFADIRPCRAQQGGGKVSMHDISFLECRSRDDGGALVTDLDVDGEWVPTGGDLLVEISARSTIASVTGSFEPQAGHEHRMRWRAEGASAWGAWTSWTTGRVLHTVAVPEPGDTSADEFEVELRPAGGTPTIATHGYIRIKKLNSGG